MITLYGNFQTIEGLTIDLRRALLAIGLIVVKEITTGDGEELKRRLWVRKVKNV